MSRFLLRTALMLLVLGPPSRLHAQPLPGTDPWEDRGDPAADMVSGLHRFLDRELAASVERRAARWARDTSAPEAYERSVEPNREHLRRILGAVDPRVSPVRLRYDSGPDVPARIADGERLAVFAVRWGVYEDVLGLGDRAEIAYFNGPHEIHGRQTFAFLAKHLDWPRGAE